MTPGWFNWVGCFRVIALVIAAQFQYSPVQCFNSIAALR